MMKKMFFAVIVLLFAAFHTAHAQQVNWQPPYAVLESFDRSIAPYGGFTSIGPNGPFIRFNPDVWHNEPWYMNVFLRAHEYGHIFSRGPYANPEVNADCWAAQQLAQSDPQVLDQVIWYMVNVMGQRGGDATHGNGYQMAQLIRQCSGR
jgi:hypothetical protein